jgi:predicted secreted protein
MAEARIGAENPMLLFIDTAGGTDYNTVVCLTQVTDGISVDETDTSSACGPNKSPGNVTISIGAEAYYLTDPDSGKVSGVDLYPIALAKTTVGFKIAQATPQVGSRIMEGQAFISSLDSTYAYDTDATFSLSLGVIGTPTVTQAS